MEIQEFRTPAELERGYDVLKELRTHLQFPEFMSLYEAAKAADGYTLLGAFQDGRCVAVMGYRILFDFVHGKHLYVDDLVVRAQERSSGLGSKFLKHAEVLAKEFGCKGLRLCTGIENERGKKFYEREGWTGRAIAYKKQVGPTV